MSKQTQRAPGWMRLLIDNGIASKCRSAWLTYCVLRRHANPHRGMTLEVDFEQAAAETGYSVSAVRKHLTRLKAIGIIERWYAAKKGGGRRLLVRIHNLANDLQRSLIANDLQRSLGYNEKRPKANDLQRALGFNHPYGVTGDPLPHVPQKGGWKRSPLLRVAAHFCATCPLTPRPGPVANSEKR